MDEYFEDLSDLEPGEDNPLDTPPVYNPLSHSYPMNIDTVEGPIEIMVQFALVQGKENLPVDLINNAEAFQVPVAIEDVPISEEGQVFEIPDDIFSEKELEPEDVVAEQALVDELTTDQNYYMIPTIVRARRLIGPISENILGETGGDLLSKEETAELVSPELLLARLKEYRDEVAADDNAPSGLLDLLNHFIEQKPLEDLDDEWDEESDQ
jgi:hypothetical protein